MIYMGLANLSIVTEALIEAGLSATTPAAAIQNGTTELQQRIISTLDKLVDTVRDHEMETPLMIIVGEVVSLAEELDWYHSVLDDQQLEQYILNRPQQEEFIYGQGTA